MRRDFDSFDPFLHEGGCNLGFRLAYIRLPEKKLTVKIGDVYCVCGTILANAVSQAENRRTHVNDVNVLEARQSEVLQDLASETACTSVRTLIHEK